MLHVLCTSRKCTIHEAPIAAVAKEIAQRNRKDGVGAITIGRIPLMLRYDRLVPAVSTRLPRMSSTRTS